jgi:hypothetical protein
MLLIIASFWRSIVVSQMIDNAFKIASSANERVLEVRTRQDLYRQQYLDYIKDMIDALQKFQNYNPGLKIPRAPVPHTIIEPTTELELQRTPQTVPGKPVVKTKTIVKYKPRPTPKPKTVFDWFKQTR